MSLKKILILGDPLLYETAEEVREDELIIVNILVQNLHDSMMEYRRKYKAGRAIAAPQIGVLKRVIYMNTGTPVVFINPRMEFPDEEQFEVWDDCMSFPGLKVKVLRYKKCRIYYKDMNFKDCVADFEGDLSELLQHEYDHLDGILATQRAIDAKSFKLELY